VLQGCFAAVVGYKVQAARTPRMAASKDVAARVIIDAPCSRDASESIDCNIVNVTTAAITKAKGRADLLAAGWVKRVFMVGSLGAVGGSF
jgi:hypothetical protein